MVANGYKEAGYEYVIIDDCWLEMERDPVTQEMLADRKRFPSGIKALADYVSWMEFISTIMSYEISEIVTVVFFCFLFR